MCPHPQWPMLPLYSWIPEKCSSKWYHHPRLTSTLHHALQGVDIVCFVRMKDTWKKVISKLKEETKAAVFHLISCTYLGQPTLNPSQRQLLKLHSKWWGSICSIETQFKQCRWNPAWLHQSSVNFCCLNPVHMNNPVASTSQVVLTKSPLRSRWCICDEDINLLLHTPSKLIWMMQAGLKAVASGSFLISDELYKSSTPILEPVLEVPPAALPQPNWQLAGSPEKMWVSWESLQIENQHLRESLHHVQEHVQVRDQVIERNNVQLLYQNLHLYKTNRPLNLKENKGKQDHTMLLDNEGQVFSSDSFMKKLEQLDRARREKAAVKTRNADVRSAKKEAMAAVEKEWVRIKEQHNIDMKAWEVECQWLVSEKVPQKSWPKKPVRPWKPKLQYFTPPPPTSSDQRQNCWSVLISSGYFFWSALSSSDQTFKPLTALYKIVSVRIADQHWVVLIRLSSHWVPCTTLSALAIHHV